MWFHVFLQEVLYIQSIQVKAKPAVKQGRKATGLDQKAGLPWEKVVRLSF